MKPEQRKELKKPLFCQKANVNNLTLVGIDLIRSHLKTFSLKNISLITSLRAEIFKKGRSRYKDWMALKYKSDSLGI